MSVSANLCVTHNSQLAASMAQLGFEWEAHPRQLVGLGRVEVGYAFSPTNKGRTDLGVMHVSLATLWQTGELQREQPNHALCVMMRAQHNYNRMVEAQDKDIHIRLVAAPGGMTTVYRPGQELPEMLARPRVSTPDMALACALGVVGIPVVEIDGVPGQRRYWLPVLGYLLADSAGAQVVHDARLLAQPGPSGPGSLAVEEVDPLHPVSLAYGALRARAEMKRQLRSHGRPQLVVTKDDMVITVAADFTGRVADKLSERLGAPFLS